MTARRSVMRKPMTGNPAAIGRNQAVDDGGRPPLRLIQGGVADPRLVGRRRTGPVAGRGAGSSPRAVPPRRRSLPEGSSAHRPVRLTRRGRLVRTVAVLVLAAGLGAAAASSGGAEPPVRRVEVHRGDTLWSIADRYSASRDPVATIERIRHLNHLSGYTIYPGQELNVPAGDR